MPRYGEKERECKRLNSENSIDAGPSRTAPAYELKNNNSKRYRRAQDIQTVSARAEEETGSTITIKISSSLRPYKTAQDPP